MSQNSSGMRNRAFIMTSLVVALLIAVFLSPFASSDPDGLDRVSQDFEFADRAVEDAPATRLPSASIFDEYALKGVPAGLATPIAGFVGTLITFGVTWAIGKLVVRGSGGSPPESPSDSKRN